MNIIPLDQEGVGLYPPSSGDSIYLVQSACGWVAQCPRVAEGIVTCSECPADPNECDELLTYEEAIEWWKEQ